MVDPAPPDPAAVLDATAAVFARSNARVAGFRGLVLPDVTLASMGLRYPGSNGVSSTRFTPETAERRIDEVLAWFGDLPVKWRFGPLDRPVDLGERLVARGFAQDPEELPGLAASLAGLPAPELDDASIELVGDPGAFRAWVDVSVAGFELSPEFGEALAKFGGLGFGGDLPVPILARIDGRPAATALAVVAGGGVEIANVTTLPDVRGRGLGRAVTLAAMRVGRDAGATIAVLQSTAMGYGVYRRLGFEPFGRYRAYVRSDD